jgi:RNA polymerase sigma-70 factor (ECF subfamily)
MHPETTPTRPDDTGMWTAAAGGDDVAFEVLFTRHSKAVYNHSFRCLASWERAEDATSLVFLEAWRRRKSVILVDGSVLPWLLGTATNVCRNLTRAARRYDAALFRLPPLSEEPDPGDAVAARVDAEAQARELVERLEGLGRGQRAAIQLVWLSGLTYAEAAAALGVPAGTVRSRVARARQILAQAVPQFAGTDGRTAAGAVMGVTPS